jgi:hypothetical protein
MKGIAPQWQVLDDVADGHSWEFICRERWGGRIPLAAVAEALKLAATLYSRNRDSFSARSQHVP